MASTIVSSTLLESLADVMEKTAEYVEVLENKTPEQDNVDPAMINKIAGAVGKSEDEVKQDIASLNDNELNLLSKLADGTPESLGEPADINDAGDPKASEKFAEFLNS